MFYPINCSTMKTVNRKSTANGYGHWFNASGTVSEYSNGYIYSEFSPASLTFNIGQEPSRVQQGNTYNIGQALVYNNGARKATAYFVFHINITDGESGYDLVEKTNGINDLQTSGLIQQDDTAYDIGGKQTKATSPGIYIQNGRKILVKP